MSKHTPGPWTAAPDTQRNKYAWRVEGASGTVPTIARLALVDRAEEIEPNARLIAAAPELLQLVKDMREAFYVQGTRKALLVVMERSKSVMEKAEGREG